VRKTFYELSAITRVNMLVLWMNRVQFSLHENVKSFSVNEWKFFVYFSRKSSLATEKSSTPKIVIESKTPLPKKKKQVSIELGHKKIPWKRSLSAPEKENSQTTFSNLTRRSKLRHKRRKSEPLYFGPLVHCNYRWVNYFFQWRKL
jgi:hypothetical protein